MHGHTTFPAQALFQFPIGVIVSLPGKHAHPAIEYGRQLPPGPFGIPLPKGTQGVGQGLGNGHRPEISHLLFVGSQEISTGGQLIVHDIEHLAFYSLDEPGKHDCLSAVVDVR
jgi:hypothetical protein